MTSKPAQPAKLHAKVQTVGTCRSVGLLAAGLGLLLASCTSAPDTSKVARSSVKPKPKEYFSEAAYGVKASPRVTQERSNLRRGGGRDQVGKPYQVRGKWYYPKEEPDYVRMGKASWYGAAFHGRLTANGEVYDMTHLSAAHPTMPLPSYARVTNMANGSSVIVRVNDRGPYAHSRIIDLSKKAAEMLDYTHSGIAEVKVEYVGRAPLNGRDDEFLLASYQPAGGRPGIEVPQPSSDVMIAMNGSTPSGTGMAFDQPSPAELALAATAQGAPAAATVEDLQAEAMQPASMTIAPAGGQIVLPEYGPLVIEKPALDAPAMAALQDGGTYALSYADVRISQANGEDSAFAALLDSARQPRVFVGTFATEKDARVALAAVGGEAGSQIERGTGQDVSLYLLADSGRELDTLLRDAWGAGFTDAFQLRD